jgi:serine/threonine protein kinase
MISHRDRVLGVFRFNPSQEILGFGNESNKWGVVSIVSCEKPVIDPKTGKEVPLCVKITSKRRNKVINYLTPTEDVCNVISIGKINIESKPWKYAIMKKYKAITSGEIKTLGRELVVQIIKDVVQGMENLKKLGYTHNDLDLSNVMYDEDADKYVIIDIDSLVAFAPVPHVTHLQNFIESVLSISLGTRPDRSLFVTPEFIDYLFHDTEVPEEVHRRCYHSHPPLVQKAYEVKTLSFFLNDRRHAETPQVMDFKLKIIGTPFDELDVESLRGQAPDGFYIPDNSTRYNLMERLLSKKVLS